MTDERYNGTELLICLSARVMEDRSSAFIGTGVPMLAAALAKRLVVDRTVRAAPARVSVRLPEPVRLTTPR